MRPQADDGFRETTMKHDGRMQRWLSETTGNAIRRTPSVHAAHDRWTAPRSMSACAYAVLRYYGIDPSRPEYYAAGAERAGITVQEVSSADTHLTMTLVLPMPWSARQMTIVTHGEPMVILPGMAFSPIIAETAIGRPLARLVGHPAFDRCQEIVVARIEHEKQDNGSHSAILHFSDLLEPLALRH